MKQSIKFETAFHQIGSTWELSEELYQILEEYTCSLYGYRRNDINSLRSEMFTKKYSNENKAIDISVLPPCRSVLILHCKKTNYVAKIWKSLLEPIVDTPLLSENGWTIDTAFPDLVEDILLDGHSSDEFELDMYSDSDDEI